MHHGLKLCLILVLISILFLWFGVAHYEILDIPTQEYYMIGMFVLQLSSWFIVINPHFLR
jgi:hypothetical protein